MYEQEAKERAYQNIAQQNTGQFIGGAIAGNAISQGVPPKASVSNEIINRLESVNGVLRDVVNMQRQLLDKLHGPRPENPNCEAKVNPAMGALGTIDERLNWVMNSAQEVMKNQQALDKLA